MKKTVILQKFSRKTDTPKVRRKIVFIIGPTGVGKTQAGLLLSGLMPCEFISADSMQVYRGMDIITDKLPKKLLRKYRHYLVDILSPSKEYNAADFCRSAKNAISRILKKEKTPVVIGGTGLYVNSLLYGIFQEVSRSDRVRKRLHDLAQERGIEFLYERLKQADPQAASKIGSNDLRRIIRALEVYEVTNKPISALQKQKTGLTEDYDIYIFGLRRQRDDLYKRIEQRIDFMLNAGLLDEVRQLLKNKLSRTAYMCIGVREVEKYFKGEISLDEAVRLLKRNSRHFAKRQMTWFNKNNDIQWIDLKEGQDSAAVAELIYHRVKQPPIISP